jgi:hypothetical protein
MSLVERGQQGNHAGYVGVLQQSFVRAIRPVGAGVRCIGEHVLAEILHASHHLLKCNLMVRRWLLDGDVGHTESSS